MPDMKFKRSGVIIHESIDGDILMCDPGLKADLIVTSELMTRALIEADRAIVLGRKVVKFFQDQREGRWLRLKQELIVIAEDDRDFVKSKAEYLKDENVKNLRKLEKDVFFWKEENGKFDENRLGKLSSKMKK